MPLNVPTPVPLLRRLRWLLPVLSLTGCAATCPTPEPVSPKLPSRPSVSTPIPSESYTESARQNSSKRQQRRMATQVMSN